MNFTAKSRYALKVMMQLREQPTKGQTHPRQSLAQRQNLSLAYMDKVLSLLKKEKLIHIERGKNGGVLLAKQAKDISLWDIFSSVENKIHPVKCLTDKSCELEDECLSKETWFEIYNSFVKSLEEKNLEDLSRKNLQRSKDKFHKKKLSFKQETHCSCS